MPTKMQMLTDHRGGRWQQPDGTWSWMSTTGVKLGTGTRDRPPGSKESMTVAETVESQEVECPWQYRDAVKRALGWVEMTLKIAPSVRWFHDDRPGADRGVTASAAEVWVNAAACRSASDAGYVVLHEGKHAQQMYLGARRPVGLTVKAWKAHRLEIEAQDYAQTACERLGIPSCWRWED